MPATSFEKDIKPLFRSIDIEHMQPFGVLLDDYKYMSAPDQDHGNARTVHDFVTGARKPRMPIGGPFWPDEQAALLLRWIEEGCNP